MPEVKHLCRLLGSRMIELCGPPTAWSRALWHVSAEAQLRELLEAAAARRDGILSDESVMQLQKDVLRALGPDPGIGDEAGRRCFQEVLSSKEVITPGSLAAAMATGFLQEIADRYLDRWIAQVRGDGSTESLERCSRAVVSHFLHRELSSTAISAAVRAAAFDRENAADSPSELLRRLKVLENQPMISYEAVMPVKRAPDSKKENAGAWIDGSQVKAWAHSHSQRPRDMRWVGGLRLTVQGRDVDSAIEIARQRLRTICDRAFLGTQHPVETFGGFWIEKVPGLQPLAQPFRGVEVASIRRQGHTYDLPGTKPALERPLALLADMNQGPAPVAVVSGWAVLESLGLGAAEGKNRVEAAPRAAALVAASYLRSELTIAAYQYLESNGDSVAESISKAGSNLERCDLILEQIRTGEALRYGRPEHEAAVLRLQILLKQPGKAIRRIRAHVEAAFRRLYRLRNMIVHGARTDAVALESGLRTSAPLVGAAVDRMHHAAYQESLPPIELIARAMRKLHGIDGLDPPALLRMLERD